MASVCCLKGTGMPFLSCLVYTCGENGFLTILTPNQRSRRSSSSCTLLAMYWSLSVRAAVLICFRNCCSVSALGGRMFASCCRFCISSRVAGDV